MAKDIEKEVNPEAESLVMAIMDDKNIVASKKLEKLLKQKAAKRITDVLDN
jgi:hypothetical protein